MDAFDILIQQHRQIQGLWTEIQQAGTLTKKKETLEKLVLTMDTHFFGEEKGLYALLENQEQQGEEMGRLRVDHELIRNHLHGVQSVSIESAEFDSHLALLVMDMRRHFEKEEHKIFPEAHRVLSPDTVQRLGESLVQYWEFRILGLGTSPYQAA